MAPDCAALYRKAHPGSVRLNVVRADIGIIGSTVFQNGLRYKWNQIPHVGIVCADNRNAIKGHALRKLHKCLLEARHIMLIGIHVISINVGDDFHCWKQLQE